MHFASRSITAAPLLRLAPYLLKYPALEYSVSKYIIRLVSILNSSVNRERDRDKVDKGAGERTFLPFPSSD